MVPCPAVGATLGLVEPAGLVFFSEIEVITWAGSWQIWQNDLCAQRKTPISLDILPVCSESSMRLLWIGEGPNFLQADSEDADQTG